MRQAHADTLTDLSNVMTAGMEEAQYATNSTESRELFGALTAGQLLRVANIYHSMFARLLGIEAGLVQQAQAATVSHMNELLTPAQQQLRPKTPAKYKAPSSAHPQG